MKALVLFTNDLRVHDNETLLQAIQEADEILCAYALEHPQDPFLLESLRDLQATLKDLGATLLVEENTPEALTNKICEEHDIEVIYTQENPNLPLLPKPTKTYPTRTLYNPQDLPIQAENKESFLRLTQNLYPPMAYAKPTKINGVRTETKPLPEKPREEQAGGESAAQELLEELLSAGGDATKLDKHLAYGTISARTVFYKSLDEEQHTNKNYSVLRYALREKDYELHQTNTAKQ